MKRLLPVLLAVLLPLPAAAAAMALYEMRLLEDGELSIGTFSVPASQIAAQALLLVDVYDFEITVNGVFYSSTYPTAQNPMPGLAGYGPSGELVTIEPPFVLSQGMPSITNLRLLRDGSFLRDACFPLDTCNPNLGIGTYELVLLSIPEPATATLVGLGLVWVASGRRPTPLR